MTNAQLVEQVFLKITGGRPTDEHGVWREDIANLLTPALAFAANPKHWEERARFYDQLRTTGFAPSEYLGELYATEEFDVQKDGDKRYIDIPDYTVISGTRGIDAVLFPSGERLVYSARMEDVVSLRFLSAAYKLNDKIYVTNTSCDKILLRYLPKYSDISVEKELPFPDDTLFRTITLLEEFFRINGFKDTIANNELDAIQNASTGNR